MQVVKLDIQIEDFKGSQVFCHVYDLTDDVRLTFDSGKRDIGFDKHNHVSEKVTLFEFQFAKVLSSAIRGKLHVGQIIHSVFIEDFPFLHDEAFEDFIRVDRRKALNITTNTTPMVNCYRIFTDGSSNNETGHSAYGGFILDSDGERTVFSQSFDAGSNNLMELKAVVEGLKLVADKERIQINTDSRFVIRGAIQWIHFWKHNDWQTAYGRKVKFANTWQELNHLCEGKLIEFNWIRGHSGHHAQSFCHDLAKKSIQRSNRS